MTKTRLTFRGFCLNFSFASFLLLSVSTIFNGGMNEEVLKYTNQFRKSKHLPALEMRENLNAIARKHSEDMARGKCGFGHAGYHQRELQVQKIIKMEYGMAENVAYGATTAKQVVSMWKGSSGHRKNMLGNYKYIGIGTARDKHGAIDYTEIFVR
jgi:uncharacterized protein YkwD